MKLCRSKLQQLMKRHAMDKFKIGTLVHIRTDTEKRLLGL